jgi:hypothetical protein
MRSPGTFKESILTGPKSWQKRIGFLTFQPAGPFPLSGEHRLHVGKNCRRQEFVQPMRFGISTSGAHFGHFTFLSFVNSAHPKQSIAKTESARIMFSHFPIKNSSFQLKSFLEGNSS